jgi:hypothetical protein
MVHNARALMSDCQLPQPFGEGADFHGSPAIDGVATRHDGVNAQLPTFGRSGTPQLTLSVDAHVTLNPECEVHNVDLRDRGRRAWFNGRKSYESCLMLLNFALAPATGAEHRTGNRDSNGHPSADKQAPRHHAGFHDDACTIVIRAGKYCCYAIVREKSAAGFYRRLFSVSNRYSHRPMSVSWVLPTYNVATQVSGLVQSVLTLVRQIFWQVLTVASASSCAHRPR